MKKAMMLKQVEIPDKYINKSCSMQILTLPHFLSFNDRYHLCILLDVFTCMI